MRSISVGNSQQDPIEKDDFLFPCSCRPRIRWDDLIATYNGDFTVIKSNNVAPFRITRLSIVSKQFKTGFCKKKQNGFNK